MPWTEGHSFDCFCEQCRGEGDPDNLTEAECMGNVYCEKCRKRFGYCSEIQNEEQQMINRSAGNDAAPASRGGRGRGRSSANQGIPYLKQENVNFDKRSANIIAAKTDSDNFNPQNQVLILKIAFAGNTYLWTLRMNNPNLDPFCEAWGNDEQKWVGKDFLLFLETDDFTNKNWFRVEIPTATKRAAK